MGHLQKNMPKQCSATDLPDNMHEFNRVYQKIGHDLLDHSNLVVGSNQYQITIEQPKIY